MTLLMEGKESRAHSMMEEFQFTGDTPALYYAQAAWEYKHNNAQKAEDWTILQTKFIRRRSTASLLMHLRRWLVAKTRGYNCAAVAFETNNVGASQAEGGPQLSLVRSLTKGLLQQTGRNALLAPLQGVRQCDGLALRRDR